jgi:nucleoside-triphosphatase THEP1
VYQPDYDKELILNGGSCLVSGPPGVGKSAMVSECVSALRERGRTVQVIAKTHVAADVAGGDTVDRFEWKHVRQGGTRADVLVVDEVRLVC